MSRSRTKGSARASIGFSIDDTDKIIKDLEKFAVEVQQKIAKESIDQALKPILRAMKANAPESRGSRDKQSSISKQAWSGTKKLKTTIKAVVRSKTKYGIVSGAIGLVGPSYSDGGGHGNLFSKNHKRKVRWGRDTGEIRIVNQFVKKTADETRDLARSAMLRALRSKMNMAIKKMAR